MTPILKPDNYSSFSSTNLELAFAEGAYLVESNQGHLGWDFATAGYDPTICCWRASAESARFSKFLAAEMYGKPPHHGYTFGGSGGGVRSLKSLEEVDGVWDGGVPFVMPHVSNMSFFSVALNAQRLLGTEGMNRAYDAVNVGGSGDPYSILSPEQAEALRTLYRVGYPRGVALNEGTGGLAGMVWAWGTFLFDRYDPTYFNDFWTQPGYLGHDNPAMFDNDIVRVEAKVKRVLTAQEFIDYKPPFTVDDRFGVGNYNRAMAIGRGMSRPSAVVLEGVSARDLGNMGWSPLRFTTGKGVGRSLAVVGVVGDAVSLTGIGGQLAEGVQPGDTVVIDNRPYLAFCYHWRHQIMPGYAEWKHFTKNGAPIYVQRPDLQKLYSAPYKYDIGDKKIIVVQGMADRGTYPSCAVAYRDKLAAKLGKRMESQYRLWLQEHHDHGGADFDPAKLIAYPGYVEQAMHELIRWVEDGKAPHGSSQFTMDDECEVRLKPTAAQRGGVQPVVKVTANGRGERLEIPAGTAVEFVVEAEMPVDVGRLTKVEWTFDGKPNYAFTFNDISGTDLKLRRNTRHVYDKPGTYFAACRVTAHPDRDKTDRLYLMRNLGRIRIVVT